MADAQDLKSCGGNPPYGFESRLGYLPIQLQYGAGQVVVTPEDQDRFVIAPQHAVWACQKAVIDDRVTSRCR
jgi:hypothetical protein